MSKSAELAQCQRRGCGNTFEKPATGRPKQYCSRSCARKVLRDEGKAVLQADLPDDVVALARRLDRMSSADRRLVAAWLDWLDHQAGREPVTGEVK